MHCRAVFVLPEGEHLQRRALRRSVDLKDAADHDAIDKHVIIAPARSLQRGSEREPGPEDFDRIKG